MYRITLYPLRDPKDGHRLFAGKFVAVLGGRQLCLSRQPLLDCARILLRDYAVDPNERIAIRHDGADHDAMTGRIGAAAKLMVIENERDGPKFGRWKPFPVDAVRPGEV